MNISTNWSAVATTARTAVMPSAMRLSVADAQARSCARVAVVASTSAAAPVARAARLRSRSATVTEAAAKRSRSPGRSGSPSSAAVPSASGFGRAPGHSTGAYRTPPTAGTPCSTTGAPLGERSVSTSTTKGDGLTDVWLM